MSNSQLGKREPASRVYAGSTSMEHERRGQALSSFPQLSQQSLESALRGELRFSVRNSRGLVEQSA